MFEKPQNSVDEAALDALSAELEAVFEATAAEPDAFVLTRMAERAKEVPSEQSWRRRLGRVWSWQGGLGACATMAAVLVVMNWGPNQANSWEPQPQSMSPTAMTDVASTPATPQGQQLAKASSSVENDDDGMLEEDDSLGLDALEMPEDLAEAEAMLEAYDQILGDS